ncbi:MAG: hypothetical protein ACOVOA_03510, partial [Allorhizobium sp.]
RVCLPEYRLRPWPRQRTPVASKIPVSGRSRQRGMTLTWEFLSNAASMQERKGSMSKAKEDRIEGLDAGAAVRSN